MLNLLPIWPAPALQRLRQVLSCILLPKGRVSEAFAVLLKSVGTMTECTYDDFPTIVDPADKSTYGNLHTAVGLIRNELERISGSYPEVHLGIPDKRYIIVSHQLPPKEWLLAPTRPLGFLIANASDWFTGNITLGVTEVCRKNGFDVLVNATQDDPDNEGPQLTALAYKCEGILMIPVGEKLSARSVAVLRSKPSVLVDRYLPGIDDIPSVHHDDKLGGKLAAKYLIGRECKRIIVVGQCSNHNSLQRLTALEDRLAGCCKAAGSVPVITELASGADEKGGFATLRKIDLIHTLDPDDGIFALTDKVALGCLSYLQSKGGDWPDLRIIGFEGQSFGEFLPRPLPSIHADAAQIGRLSAEVLVAKIEGRPLPPTNRFPHFLVSPTALLIPNADGEGRHTVPINSADAASDYS